MLDYQKGRVLCDVSEELNAQAFQSFIENTVLPAYSGRKIVMILDNSKIHHAKVLSDFKEKYKDILIFLFLPPYAQTINRIEGLWKWLKEMVICNRLLTRLEVQFLNSSHI